MLVFIKALTFSEHVCISLLSCICINCIICYSFQKFDAVIVQLIKNLTIFMPEKCGSGLILK